MLWFLTIVVSGTSWILSKCLFERDVLSWRCQFVFVFLNFHFLCKNLFSLKRNEGREVGWSVGQVWGCMAVNPSSGRRISSSRTAWVIQWVRGYPGLHIELKGSQVYRKLCLQQAIKITMKRKYIGNFSLKSFMALNKCHFFFVCVSVTTFNIKVLFTSNVWKSC